MSNDAPPSAGDGPPLIHDIFGLKPYGEMSRDITQAMIQGTSAFLSRICLPVAEEIGDWAKEEVHHMRKRRKNAIRIAEKARRVVEAELKAEVHAPPRLVSQIIEIGSWSDEEELQDMWAALLATACTPEGRDDSNMIYTDLLGRMTLAQVRLLNFLGSGLAHRARPINSVFGAVTMVQKTTKLQEIMQLSTADDVFQQVEFMRSIGLLQALELQSRMFYARDKSQVQINPTRLGVSMYMRCQGFRGALEAFYDQNSTIIEEPGSA